MGAKMADAAFAMKSRAASPVARAERPSARPNSSSQANVADFHNNLSSDRSESVSAALKLTGVEDRQVSPGGGLLGNGVAFILAETRTQEAGAPLPPVSNFERARNRYLETQAQIRDTVAANSILRGETDISSATAAYAAHQAGGSQPSVGYVGQGIDDEFEETAARRPQFATDSLI